MKRTILASLSFCILLAGAGQSMADSFGAIAYSPRTGALGWSYDHTSRRNAERAAQSNCDASDCRVAIWFDQACGAVARGPDGWGSGWGYSRREAENQAIGSCRQNSHGCQVIRWQCSGAR
ncbi:protein of unknown function DUF4189 [Rhizobium sp. CF080]|jgi:serine/threonine-protein kinase|uniref:DUF4189 domain-containing protein n=1 Tax=Rhizobium sp. (strain CF080) TaxID=1144310 RepID=UPI0003E7F93B|nr:DUF4189 domain-containing protein [Rhizobium sp. CF080]EUB96229.1 protein of unknown function DUF4189 [Rhizobium sp. CF080]